MHSESFFNFLRFEKRFSPHTLTAYSNDLHQFSTYLLTEYELASPAEANHLLIRSWVVSLMDKEMTAKSVNRKITTLKTYYKFLLREGLIEADPTLKIQSPRLPKRLPVYVEEGDMDTLISGNDFEDSFKGWRDRLIIELLYATGMRLAELISLEEKNIDLSQQVIKVLGKRNKERIIPVHDDVVETIRNYLRYKKEIHIHTAVPYLFVTDKGRTLYPKYVYSVVRENLGHVTTLTKRSPHVLRHTFATHLLNNGADLNAIKELLGHSSLAATQVYTHNSIEKLKNIYKQAHPKG